MDSPGPLGGDELKVVTKGGNFGWPLGRVRDVVELPSGALLILIDTGSPAPSDNGRIVKLTPRER